ncbi:hypothetical protein [Chryseolinea lacunae]|uniref:Uncharacterized protein n=1 Tax=Chryseolinea lacunae TaxID=2801331 RepID=A0ABS1KRU8_9BACT|nr:hypothetical protein [Chryseolinea lacunae]MBL0742070.1 hypothetical protein [Chryseolinea lacunae]
MEKFFCAVLASLCLTGYGQNGEFTTYKNGLIYDEGTMNRLGVIVDSLNLQFKSCSVSKPHNALPQGNATFVSLEGHAAEARKAIAKGMSLREFRKKFRSATFTEVWIIKSRYADDGEELIRYRALPQGNGDELSFSVKRGPETDKTSGWVVGPYEDFLAVYIDNLRTSPLPQTYARLVQYVDCMIDTTAEIFLPGATYDDRFFSDSLEENLKAKQFTAWAESFPGKPHIPSYDDRKNTPREELHKIYLAYARSYRTWDSLRLVNLDNKMRNSPQYATMLKEACDDAMTRHTSDDALEFYVARYISRKDALQLMRSRMVMGACSQDQSPRVHAMNICRLAAETAQWDIFLRSHLNIMNDRFERASDGSYAWLGRKTYLRELEELKIDAVDLLLGTSFRVANITGNHYWGSISRTGRALSDAKDKDALEKNVLSIVQDNTLDLYNRMLMAYVFDNYAYNLADEKRKKAATKNLAASVKTWPLVAQKVWKKRDE